MSDEEILDDFFSKKDKTKKPKKKKKTKTETPETQSESKKVAQPDEWNDFEEQKEKDFSNLKIVDLQGDEDEREEYEDQTNNDVDDVDGEDGEAAQKNAGIWKVSNAPSSAPAPVPQAPKEAPGSHNVVSGKYVPPSMKRATMASASQPSRRHRGAPPDIKSQAAFPTLSAASEDTNTPSDFEMVKNGTRTSESRRNDNTPQLEVGNRYDSLRR